MSLVDVRISATSQFGQLSEQIGGLDKRLRVIERGGLTVSGGTGGGTVIDATTLLKGKLRLTNDFAGTADSPVVVSATGDTATGRFDVHASAAVKGPRPWVDVTHPGYGADPDGASTSNQVTAINNAITDVAAAGGGEVRIPGPGTYYIGSQITYKSGVTLRGVGDPVIAPNDAYLATDNYLSLVGPQTYFIAGSNEDDPQYAQENVTIQGLRFDGRGWGQPGGKVKCLTCYSTKHLRILDCEFKSANSLIFIAGCEDVTYRTLRFSDWGLPFNPAALSNSTYVASGNAITVYSNNLGTVQAGTVSTNNADGSAGKNVTGSGTTFTSALVGQWIKVGTESRKVVSFTDATHISLEYAFTSSASGAAWTLLDATPSSHHRGYDLGFKDAEWGCLYIFGRDCVFTNFTSENVKEGVIYTHGAGWRALCDPAPWQASQDCVFSDFTARDTWHKDISGTTVECGGTNIAVRNFNIEGGDSPGLQINWPARGIVYENGRVADTVRDRVVASITNTTNPTIVTRTEHRLQQGDLCWFLNTGTSLNGAVRTVASVTDEFTFAVTASAPGAYTPDAGTVIYANYREYAQVQALQTQWTATADTAMNGIKIRNVSVGRPGLTPRAKYAVGFKGASGLFMLNVALDNVETAYGYRTADGSQTLFTPASCAYSAQPILAGALARKVHSDVVSVELVADTRGSGKYAALSATTGTIVGQIVADASTSLVSVGSFTAHDVSFKRNGIAVFTLASSTSILLGAGVRISGGDGIVVKTGSTPMDDGDFVTATDGMLAIDSTTHTLRFRSGGSWHDAGGGSFTPTSPFTISDATFAKIQSFGTGNSSTGAVFAQGKDAGGVTIGGELFAGTTVVGVGSNTNHDVHFRRNSSTVFYLSSSGHVQFGSGKRVGFDVDPAAAAHFARSSTPVSTDGWQLGSDSTPLRCWSPGADRMQFDTNLSATAGIGFNASAPAPTAVGAWMAMLTTGVRFDLASSSTTTPTGGALRFFVAGESSPRISIRPDIVRFGDGTSFDVGIKRSGANELSIDNGAGSAITLKLVDVTSSAILKTGSTNGLMIGSASSDKVGFFACTPKQRPSAMTTRVSAITNSTGGTSGTTIGAPPAFYVTDGGYLANALASILTLLNNNKTRIDEMADSVNENATTGLGLISGTA